MNDNRNFFHKNSFPSSSSQYQSILIAKGNNQHFDISGLYHDFEQDELATQEFIDVALTVLLPLKVELFDAFQQNDLTTYKQAHFRILTTLKMIKASTLQNLLEQGRDLIVKELKIGQPKQFSQIWRKSLQQS